MRLFARHIVTVATVGMWTAFAISVCAAVPVLAAGDVADVLPWLPIDVASVVLFYIAGGLLFPGRRLRRAAAGSKGLYREAERLIAAMPVDQTYRTDAGTVLERLSAPLLARVIRCDMSKVDLPQIDQQGVAVVEVFTLLAPLPLVHRHVDGMRIDVGLTGRVVPVDDDTSGTSRGGDTPRGGWREAIRAARHARTGLTLASTDELRELVEQLRVAAPVES